VPSITASISDLTAIGPVIDLQIAVPIQVEGLLARDQQPLPTPVPASLLVDTGASNTVIQSGIAQRLGLQPVGTVRVNTPSSANVECPQYSVRLLLPKGLVATVTAIEAPLQGQNIHGLIGRDLLQHGVLVYLGTENQFTLSF
jgi:predicted aspartyl protease